MNDLFFLEVKCENTHRDFYARFDYAADHVWTLTYGVKSLPVGGQLSNRSQQQDISNMRIGPQYKCPYCGNTHFVKCGSCGKLTCYKGSGWFTCAYCGNTGSVGGFIERIDTSNAGKGQG